MAQARDMGAVLTEVFERQGLGPYSQPDIATGTGIALALTNVVCLVLAIAFSVPRLRQRRRAFWVPIVCAAVALVATLLCVGVALAADPSFVAYVQGQARTP